MPTTFEIIARSGQTAIPQGTGNFTGFGFYPAIDKLGNIAFIGSGGATPSSSFQSGIYKAGATLERVAARGMTVPGSSALFDVFLGESFPDIDGGAVAFLADISPTSKLMAAYTNIGGTLRQVAIANGVDCSAVGEPVVDGSHVFVRVTKGGTVSYIRDWAFGSFTEVGTVNGLTVALNTQVDAEAGNRIYRRYSATVSDLAINNTDSIAAIGQAAPGGGTFRNLSFNPALSGDDAAFSASTSLGSGVFKRVNGTLLQVAHQTVAPPGGGSFRGFNATGVGIANEVCAFSGAMATLKNAIYIDLDGLAKLVTAGDVIEGFTVQNISFSGRGIAYTANGYELVFRAELVGAGTAIIRAIVEAEGEPPPPPPEPDYTWTITEGTNTVALTSTRGTVDPASAVANPDATFVTTEADGERTHKVTLG